MATAINTIKAGCVTVSTGGNTLLEEGAEDKGKV
ncbi:hypothetical protein PC129_g20503 [Phytophthora cactorum]|uniref:Uncharacterized protein n=1 Tax=Phytophthora cactorum TaxID=29920 RepID=A0A8T0YUP7_9STRA|nr:hypothetical protein Pcac1_g15496 [Phytophthora cactorum]KAG2852631.1 hypothetical protein PC113_g14853 [Phytophthora cactorum]KAG2893856.1 hypothetical protein PC114_g16110 [Phytophthora cactorum]KAG2929795.1 hypothetical protein PC117_g13908 [Phytophthora cactorum]KAG3006522.1 hypothetical protein PC119_g14925 [Phytophthora cactorum]